jgi:hypothetical protein
LDKPDVIIHALTSFDGRIHNIYQPEVTVINEFSVGPANQSW